MNWYILAIKNGLNFSGRARRSEYWMFGLVHAVIFLLLFVLFFMTHANYFIFILMNLYGLVMIVPNIAVLVRRLHDINKSGWYFWVCLIPLVGIFVLFYFLVMDSQGETNQYGISPKYQQ
ncbi:DUF805 domain-containing protein [Vibrio tritonius]|uniref:DUF805 domain-containing protein n=1 Tax=Vibrio tritonius TaxID=1435069 RepID=A0ABS7YRF6_9VIBR|nr:DUF805 domain-containing protein [Vibrio tritonius]MCA2018273.1 DUF805 domain-containing protein [Vibrio tritonius]